MTRSALGAGERARGAAATALTAGAIGYALLLGLASPHRVPPPPQTALFAIEPARLAPPPPRPATVHRHAPRARTAAAPPSLRATATDLVAPPPLLAAPTPPLLATTRSPESGAAPAAGAASVAGVGPGAGGEGAGRGGGGGSGDGDGYTPPRRRSGRLKDSDYPQAAGAAERGGRVSVRYAVEVDGRVDDCVVTGSSGDEALDATTCRLIEQRFRYDPSRDPQGRPVRSFVTENHEWVMAHEPPLTR